MVRDPSLTDRAEVVSTSILVGTSAEHGDPHRDDRQSAKDEKEHAQILADWRESSNCDVFIEAKQPAARRTERRTGRDIASGTSDRRTRYWMGPQLVDRKAAVASSSWSPLRRRRFA